MSDFKSKLPDFKELSAMGSKLFRGIKSSIEEIIHDYKQKRAVEEATMQPTEVVSEPIKPTTRARPKPAKKPVVTPTVVVPPVDPVIPDGTDTMPTNEHDKIK